jgi:hypothetical protein
MDKPVSPKIKAREERLAAALKRNLARRKDAARRRDVPDGEEAVREDKAD